MSEKKRHNEVTNLHGITGIHGKMGILLEQKTLYGIGNKVLQLSGSSKSFIVTTVY